MNLPGCMVLSDGQAHFLADAVLIASALLREDLDAEELQRRIRRLKLSRRLRRFSEADIQTTLVELSRVHQDHQRVRANAT